ERRRCASPPEVWRPGAGRARTRCTILARWMVPVGRHERKPSSDPRGVRLAPTADATLRSRAGDVRAWLDDRAEDMAALLESLIAIDSENPPGRALGRCGRIL